MFIFFINFKVNIQKARASKYHNVHWGAKINPRISINEYCDFGAITVKDKLIWIICNSKYKKR